MVKMDVVRGMLVLVLLDIAYVRLLYTYYKHLVTKFALQQINVYFDVHTHPHTVHALVGLRTM